jgi:hypothetical protein
VLTIGISLAAESPVDTLPTKDQERVAVTQLTNGMIVFAWEDESTGKSEVWFRRYDSNLVALADHCQRRASAPRTSWNRRSPLAAGGFIITYEVAPPMKWSPCALMVLATLLQVPSAPFGAARMGSVQWAAPAHQPKPGALLVAWHLLRRQWANKLCVARPAWPHADSLRWRL